jgi:hypothetical protein
LDNWTWTAFCHTSPHYAVACVGQSPKNAFAILEENGGMEINRKGEIGSQEKEMYKVKKKVKDKKK